MSRRRAPAYVAHIRNDLAFIVGQTEQSEAVDAAERRVLDLVGALAEFEQQAVDIRASRPKVERAPGGESGVRQASIERAREIVADRTKGSLPIAEWGPMCEGCGSGEFRIDGYCSCECREYHDDVDVEELGGIIDSLASALAEAERQRDEARYERDDEQAARITAEHRIRGHETRANRA
jgi:hypothetical protein